MPRTPTDYSNTIIYKIVSNDLSIIDCYVGHTTNFRKRKNHHKDGCNNEKDKHYHYKIYKIIRANGGWENWCMVEIEKFPCVDGNEARARERYWYELLNPNMNSRLPIISKKEYYENHKEDKREYDKIYREINKDKRTEQKKQYYEANKEELNNKAKNKKWTCPLCNKEIRKDSKNKHNRTIHSEIK